MKLKQKVVTSVIFLAALTGRAQAAVIADLGPDPLAFSNFTVSHSPGVFSDVFTFSLTNISDTIASTIALTVGSFSAISFSGFGLYNDPTATGTGGNLVASGVLSSGNTEGNFSQSSIGTGSYYFQLDGNATGSLGGVYLFSANASASPPAPLPIPEPETYALMIAGLSLLGFIARRRKASGLESRSFNLSNPIAS
jgi:hypothetical protein